MSFFKVVDMSPAVNTSLIVDSKRSNITLEVFEPSKYSPLTVSEVSAEESTGVSWLHLRLVHGTGLQGSCPCSLPVGAEAYHSGGQHQGRNRTDSSDGSSAVPIANGNGADMNGSVDEAKHIIDAGFLGAAVDGALRKPAVLEGVGTLMPAWRHIAQLVAPLCHHVSSFAHVSLQPCPP